MKPKTPKRKPSRLEKAWSANMREFSYLARTQDRLKEAFQLAWEKGKSK